MKDNRPEIIIPHAAVDRVLDSRRDFPAVVRELAGIEPSIDPLSPEQIDALTIHRDALLGAIEARSAQRSQTAITLMGQGLINLAAHQRTTNSP